MVLNKVVLEISVMQNNTLSLNNDQPFIVCSFSITRTPPQRVYNVLSGATLTKTARSYLEAD
jgi:hypothetical protein